MWGGGRNKEARRRRRRRLGNGKVGGDDETKGTKYYIMNKIKGVFGRECNKSSSTLQSNNA